MQAVDLLARMVKGFQEAERQWSDVEKKQKEKSADLARQFYKFQELWQDETERQREKDRILNERSQAQDQQIASLVNGLDRVTEQRDKAQLAAQTWQGRYECQSGELESKEKELGRQTIRCKKALKIAKMHRRKCRDLEEALQHERELNLRCQVQQEIDATKPVCPKCGRAAPSYCEHCGTEI